MIDKMSQSQEKLTHGRPVYQNRQLPHSPLKHVHELIDKILNFQPVFYF